MRGAWPGVSWTDQGRDRSRSRPRQRARDRARCTGDPRRGCPCALGVAFSAASGTPLWRPTSRRRASAASGSSPPAWRARGEDASTARSRRAHDRRGLAPVVGVRVGAGQQPHMLEPEVDLIQRALELGQRSGFVHAGVDQHHAEPAAIAHALQCGTPGQGSGRRSRHRPGSTRSPGPVPLARVTAHDMVTRRLRRLDGHHR